MLVENLMKRLARSPVGDLAMGGSSSGTIPTDKVPAFIDWAQDALTELHTKFPLSVKTLTLRTLDGRFEYPLLTKHAQTSAEEPMADKFIMDSMSSPYTGDILKLEHVLDEQMNELGLNDRRDPTSWFATGPTTLAMDYPVSNVYYFVQYRANHAVLDPSVLTLGTQRIAIPVTLEEALVAKIGYFAFTSQTGEDAAIKAQVLMGRYNEIISEMEAQNVLNSSVTDTRETYIKAQGWP